MERIITPLGILIALSLVAYGAVTFMDNPMDKRRASLDEILDTIQPEEEIWETSVRTNFADLRKTISGNRRLWDELIPPPPAPIRKPPTLDLKKKLASVKITRQSFGAGDSLKVKIISQPVPKGAFYAVGDRVSGVKIIAIDKTSVTFGMFFNGKNYTHSMARP